MGCVKGVAWDPFNMYIATQVCGGGCCFGCCGLLLLPLLWLLYCVCNPQNPCLLN